MKIYYNVHELWRLFSYYAIYWEYEWLVILHMWLTQNYLFFQTRQKQSELSPERSGSASNWFATPVEGTPFPFSLFIRCSRSIPCCSRYQPHPNSPAHDRSIHLNLRNLVHWIGNNGQRSDDQDLLWTIFILWNVLRMLWTVWWGNYCILNPSSDLLCFIAKWIYCIILS